MLPQQAGRHHRDLVPQEVVADGGEAGEEAAGQAVQLVAGPGTGEKAFYSQGNKLKIILLHFGF